MRRANVVHLSGYAAGLVVASAPAADAFCTPSWKATCGARCFDLVPHPIYHHLLEQLSVVGKLGQFCVRETSVYKKTQFIL
jgi:hypothetical protein